MQLFVSEITLLLPLGHVHFVPGTYRFMGYYTEQQRDGGTSTRNANPVIKAEFYANFGLCATACSSDSCSAMLSEC